MRSFTIELGGHRYQGAWKFEGEDHIEVRSDYGKRRADLYGADAGEVARRVLASLVAARQQHWGG